jgi:hypothetical protein
LILAYDHRAAVAPEIKGDLAIGGQREQVVLNGNVEIGVGLIAEEKLGHGRDVCFLLSRKRGIGDGPT